MTSPERTTRLTVIPAAAMRTERIPRHRLVELTEPSAPAAAQPTVTRPGPGPADADTGRVEPAPAAETTAGPTGLADPGHEAPDLPTAAGPTNDQPAVENELVASMDRSNAPRRRSRRDPGRDGEPISTGSGDPADGPSTTNLGPVTERILGQDQPPPGPPVRPRFEFRPPPSAVCAPRPPLLGVASLLWLAAAVVLVVAVVLPLVGVGDLWADIAAVVARDFPNETAVTRDRVVAAVMGTLVGGGVLLALGEAAAAAAMRRGRPAARIVLALLLVVAAVHAVLAMTLAPAVIAALLGVASALALGGAVLMFLPGTTGWLHRPRR